MDLELNRLASFAEYQREHDDHLSSITLARKGFLYNGRLLVCFQCQMPLPTDEHITAENLDEVHRRNSSNCSNREAANVPLTQPQWSLTESDGTLPEEPISAIYRLALARARSRGVFPGDAHPGRERVHVHAKHEQFRDEAARLASFLGWPQGAPVQPDTLATAGFFYTGTGDRVCCAFCDGVLSGWERGDDPKTEHDRHYGDRNCPYRRHQRQDRQDGYRHDSGPEIDGNDRQRSNFRNTTAPIERPDWSERRSVIRNESPSSRLSLLTAEQSSKRHRHPEFADQLQRIRSYPSEAFRTGQRSESLARAGFFYEGPDDRVRCFHCAGLLKNWQPADVPIDEHQRWFPECHFVKSLRNDVASRQMQSSAFSVGLTAAHFSPTPVYPVEPREIKARLDSASVVALLQMGFSKTLIRQAIEIRLRTTGDDFSSAESLLEAVFELQEKMSLESSDGSRGHGNDEQAGHLASSKASNVIAAPAAADRKEINKQTASVSQLPVQMTQTPVAYARNESMRGSPASDLASPRDESISQPDKPKSKSKKKTKKSGQKKTPDNLKIIESNDAVSDNCVEGPMDTSEMDPTDAEIIVQENRKLKEARTCKVCLDSDVNTVFLPCGHLVCCHSCSSALRLCPMCRVLIRGTVRVFLP